MKIFSKSIKLSTACAIMSVFTMVAYHFPFFKLVLKNIEGGLNGVLITAGLAVIMLALNYFFYYLVMRPGKIVGKCLLAFMFIADAVSLYFINTYEVLITDKMMGNVFNTQFSEASGFFSFSLQVVVSVRPVLPVLPRCTSCSMAVCAEDRLWHMETIFCQHRRIVGHCHSCRIRTYAELALDRPQFH